MPCRFVLAQIYHCFARAVNELGERRHKVLQTKKDRIIGPFLKLHHPGEIASVGQLSTQSPQSVQVFASITYLSSPSEIEFDGHSLSQAPHEIQSSLITYAMVLPPLFIYLYIVNTKAQKCKCYSFFTHNCLSHKRYRASPRCSPAARCPLYYALG